MNKSMSTVELGDVAHGGGLRKKTCASSVGRRQVCTGNVAFECQVSNQGFRAIVVNSRAFDTSTCFGLW